MKLFNSIEKHLFTIMSIVVVALLGATLFAAKVANSDEPTATTTTTTIPVVTTTSTTTTTTIPPTTTTTPPPTPEEMVNSIVYIHHNPAPAMQAFAIVATARGWSPEQIQQWSPFAENVMLRESGFCYNLRRGAIIGKAEGCVMQRQGRHEDSGFAQLIAVHYAPGRWLCEQEHLCSAEDIIATPWNSMTSFIALIERNGRQPWCYTDALRAQSRCRNAPRNPPAI